MTEPRKHHYISQCYLKGFAERRHKKAMLQVWEVESGRSFKTRPEGVGAERDFNRIEIDGIDPNQIEKAFSGFERELDGALDRIIAARSLENADDRNLLMNLITALVLRNPKFRDNFGNFHDEITKRMLGLMIASEERWESQRQQMAAAGHDVSEMLSYAEMKEFYDRGEFKMLPTNTFMTHLELTNFNEMLPYVAARKWTMLVAPDDGNPFIASDHPARLTWSEPQASSLYGPGLGMPNTAIYFPLSKEIALLGTFEGQERVYRADAIQVAEINGEQVATAKAQIYTPHEGFGYMLSFAVGLRGAVHLSADRAHMNEQRAKKSR
jgi:hypothetical protein